MLILQPCFNSMSPTCNLTDFKSLICHFQPHSDKIREQIRPTRLNTHANQQMRIPDRQRIHLREELTSSNQRERRFRKLSFGDDEDHDEEVGSAHAASSCSGHEIQSAISDDADCSQSDISLCDDGVSEEDEGDCDNFLGHLFKDHDEKNDSSEREADDSQEGSGVMKSYECEDEIDCSL